MSARADIYPVGVLSALQIIGRALWVRSEHLRGRRMEIIRREVRREYRAIVRHIRERDWSALRDSFNGYLAEHDNHPHNCGTGWTKRAAERRADRLCRTESTGATQ